MQKDNQHSSQPEPIVTDDSTVLQPDLFTCGAAVITEPPDPQTTPFPPLPQLLFDDEVQRLLQSATEEPRAHCLVYLILHAVLKTEAATELKIEHSILTKQNSPTLPVHFDAATGKQRRDRRRDFPAE